MREEYWMIEKIYVLEYISIADHIIEIRLKAITRLIFFYIFKKPKTSSQYRIKISLIIFIILLFPVKTIKTLLLKRRRICRSQTQFYACINPSILLYKTYCI